MAAVVFLVRTRRPSYYVHGTSKCGQSNSPTVDFVGSGCCLT